MENNNKNTKQFINLFLIGVFYFFPWIVTVLFHKISKNLVDHENIDKK